MGYISDYALQAIITQPQGASFNYQRHQAQVARRLFNQARLAARLRRLLAALTGRSTDLQDLNELTRYQVIGGGYYAGMRAVKLSQIRGSEGRTHDFDCEFSPLRLHNEGRWLSVATARLRGEALPPVELIQVGDVYYVRDGHHRISVARALGEEAIDAEVLVWGNAASTATAIQEHLERVPQAA